MGTRGYCKPNHNHNHKYNPKPNHNPNHNEKFDLLPHMTMSRDQISFSPITCQERILTQVM